MSDLEWWWCVCERLLVKNAYLGALQGTIVVFGLLFSGFPLRHALNANASLLQVSSISILWANFWRFIPSMPIISLFTIWLIADEVDGASHFVAVSNVFKSLVDVYIWSVYGLICDFPSFSDRLWQIVVDSVELLVDANLQFGREGCATR